MFNVCKCFLSNQHKMVRRAICVIKGTGVSGVFKFEQESDCSPLKVSGEVNGLTKGLHGFHVHEYGDLSDGCTSAGAHYNPHNQTHGGLNDKERHLGDFGNLEADEKGRATVSFTDNVATLFGDYSIIGRAMVVHADPDDLGKGSEPDSKTNGHSGERVGCGIIGIAK